MLKKSNVGNQQGYDLWASFYDQYPNPTVASDELNFPKYWSHITQKKVLEIGCGTGRHTCKLLNQNNKVVGIDLSAGMLEEARKKFKEQPAELLNENFLTYDGFSPESFDAAVTSLVVEHIADLFAFFKKVSWLLKPQGEFFISEIHPSRTAKGVLAHFQDPATEQEIHLEGYPHSEQDFIESAAKAGLTVVENRDILGDVRLSELNSKWNKYIGAPMIKIFVFKKNL